MPCGHRARTPGHPRSERRPRDREMLFPAGRLSERSGAPRLRTQPVAAPTLRPCARLLSSRAPGWEMRLCRALGSSRCVWRTSGACVQGGNEPRGRVRPASTPLLRFSGNRSGCHDLSSWRALRGSGKLKRAEPCAQPPGVKSLLSRLSLSSSPAPHHLAAVSGAFTLAHTGHGIFTAAELSCKSALRLPEIRLEI